MEMHCRGNALPWKFSAMEIVAAFCRGDALPGIPPIARCYLIDYAITAILFNPFSSSSRFCLGKKEKCFSPQFSFAVRWK